jgi:nucleoside-diphosphate-sugar epimerase
MKALITGATGYIGSNLARRLVDEGWDVHIIVRSNSNLYLINDILNKISIHIHDGTTEGMIDICKKADPKIVFHLAASCIPKHEPKDIYSLFSSNILFGTQLLEGMSKNNIRYLINTGTSWQHYKNDEYNPMCLYAATKQGFEDILEYYIQGEGLRAITLKLFDTYGPNDPRSKIINLLKDVSISGTELSMSPGEQYIDLVYIDDVIEAFSQAAIAIRSNFYMKHECYAVSSGKPMKLRDLVKIFEKVYGNRLKITWGGRAYRKREVMIPWNTGKLLVGWIPKVSIEEGIYIILKNKKDKCEARIE